MNRGEQPDMPAVAALLAERMADLSRELAGDPSGRTRTALRFGTRGSLAVEIAGAKRGSWFDYEAWQGGDALALVAHLRGGAIVDAWRWALGWLGIREGSEHRAASSRPTAPQARSPEPRPLAGTLDLARTIWREAMAADAPGSLVPVYFAARRMALEAGAPLRFHPSCPRGAERRPALLALMTDATTGEPCGVHRTFLLPDGSAKAHPGANGEPAKMMAGRAGLVRLVPDADVTMGLGLAEGIETALSVMQGYGWRPVWAATSAGMVRAFPVLRGIEHLTIFADADGAGMVAAEECAARWADAGCGADIITAPPGQDFNDTLRSRAA